MGSKNRIAKDILPIILKDRNTKQWYVETMVGGGNLIDKVDGLRMGADINPYVIEALKFIRDTPEKLPDHVSEGEYEDFKTFQELDGITGVVGIVCSFGGRWFRSYAKNADGRNYARAGKRNALAQSPKLKGCIFINSSYKFLDIPPKSIIYCDPPYEGTAGYIGGFMHSEFWEWARIKSREGHSVFISEYNAPADFDCVWSKETVNQMNNIGGARCATEKLFTYSDLI